MDLPEKKFENTPLFHEYNVDRAGSSDRDGFWRSDYPERLPSDGFPIRHGVRTDCLKWHDCTFILLHIKFSVETWKHLNGHDWRKGGVKPTVSAFFPHSF